MNINSVLSKKKIFFIIFSVIFVLSLFWKNYYLGGDDTRLYYLYPQDYFQNFSKNIILNSSLSSFDIYFPQNYIIPFNFLLIILKTVIPVLNLQFFLFWLNILGGVYFFYKLLTLLAKPEDKYLKVAFILSSLFYVFSIFNLYTLFVSQLFSLYLISIFPLALYLFFKALEESKVYYVVADALILSLMSIVLVSVPYVSAYLLITIPLLIYYAVRYKLRFFVYGTIFVFLIIFLNLHWIFYILNILLANTKDPGAGVFLQTSFRSESGSGIRNTALLNDVFYPLLNLYYYRIQTFFHWTYNYVYENWYLKLVPLYIVFPLTVIGAGYCLKKSSNYIKIFSVVFVMWLLNLYLFTVNISSFGVNLYVYLSSHLPGFVMFRNMYDKFASPMAFTYSLVLGLSILIIFDRFNNTGIKKFVLGIFALMFVVNIFPYVTGRFFVPIWRSENTYQKITGLNHDYLDMVTYIKEMKTDSKFLVLPLTQGNNELIQDEYTENYYYSGVSPLLIFTGKNDFSGLMSFGAFENTVDTFIREKDYIKLGEVLQRLNVGYIIINKTITQDLINSYHYGSEFYQAQNGVAEGLSGEKISDFGDRYSLYKIKPEYSGEYIFINDGFTQFSPSNSTVLTYEMVSPGTIKVNISGLKNESSLIFLEPYNSRWKILDSDKNELHIKNDTAYGYANSWKLSENGSYYLYFSIYKYHNLTVFISIVSFVGVAIYLFIKILNKKES